MYQKVDDAPVSVGRRNSISRKERPFEVRKPNEVDFNNNGAKVTLNGKKIGDGVLENGTIYLPVREVTEVSGMGICRDPKIHNVNLEKR